MLAIGSFIALSFTTGVSKLTTDFWGTAADQRQSPEAGLKSHRTEDLLGLFCTPLVPI
jgi:hypothetical protein